jgi:hypothetical protein
MYILQVKKLIVCNKSIINWTHESNFYIIINNINIVRKSKQKIIIIKNRGRKEHREIIKKIEA